MRARIRAYAGLFALLAALGLVAAFWSSGVTRLANRITDDGLRSDLAGSPWSIRDVTYRRPPAPLETSVPIGGELQLDRFRDGLPAVLRSTVGDAWYIAEAGPAPVQIGAGPRGSCPPLAAVRWQTGSPAATRMIRGHRPASSGEVQAIIGADAAEALGLGVGDTFRISGPGGTAPVRITGVFQPVRPAAPIWDDMRLARTSCPNLADGTRARATLLTDSPGADRAAILTQDVELRWRYRIDEARVTAADLPGLSGAVLAARRAAPPGVTVQTNLDRALATFDGQLRSVRALLAVIRAGILATLLGLILLAARLVVDRRADEYALIRARGGSAAAAGLRTLGETLAVVPPAIAAGWLLGAAVPGRADRGEAGTVILVGLVATLAAPVVAVLAARHPVFTSRRSDLVRRRPSLRRLTAEASVVLFAVLGLVLLRRRGLSPAVGVDPYLVVVPVLLAVAVAVIALRVVPVPLAWAGRLGARARGVVAFLGLSGAARGAPLSAGPLAALVVAVATGVFTSVVSSTVGHARDVAAGLSVPADAQVTGFQFAADTAGRIAGLPGVSRAVPVLLESGVDVVSVNRGAFVQAQMMVVDAAGAWDGLPTELAGARPGDGPVPMVVSPEVARTISGEARVNVQGRPYRFRVAAVRESVPGIEAGTRQFVVLPAQAMPIPADQPLLPNRILLTGDGFDVAAVRGIADAGQRARIEALTGRPAADWQLIAPATVVSRQEVRDGLDRTGVNGVLVATALAAVAAAVVLALLTVAFTVLAGAPARGRALSRLRTMGLSGRQSRRLLVYELVPLIAAALLAGALAGIALPGLVGPALGLGGFTAGVAARTYVDPLLAGGVLVVAVLAMAAALAVENVVNRRLRLGEVLRLGEES
jgi:putative ABC transport system permease protein